MLAEAAFNQLKLSGVLTERNSTRFTPAGVPVCEGRLLHQSEQLESGKPRQVTCEVSVVALGEQSRWLEAVPLGSTVCLSGFLSARRLQSKSLVLHIQQIDFLEGKQNGTLL